MGNRLVRMALLGVLATVVGTAQAVDLNEGEWLKITGASAGDIYTGSGSSTATGSMSTVGGVFKVSGLPGGGYTGPDYSIVNAASNSPATMTINAAAGMEYTYEGSVGVSNTVGSLSGVYAASGTTTNIVYNGGPIKISADFKDVSAVQMGQYGIYNAGTGSVTINSGDIHLSGSFNATGGSTPSISGEPDVLSGVRTGNGSIAMNGSVYIDSYTLIYQCGFTC